MSSDIFWMNFCIDSISLHFQIILCWSWKKLSLVYHIMSLGLGTPFSAFLLKLSQLQELLMLY